MQLSLTRPENASLSLLEGKLDKLKIRKLFHIKKFKISNLGTFNEIYLLGENSIGKTLILNSIYHAFLEQEKSEILYYRLYKNDIIKDYNHCDINSIKPCLNILRDKNDFSDNILNFLNIVFKEKYTEDTLLFERFENDIRITNAFNHTCDYYGLSENIQDFIAFITHLFVSLRLYDSKIVLLDDFNFNLHPKIKYEIIELLKKEFSSIQFIISTNDLNIIQGAGKESLIFRLYKEYDGLVAIKIRDFNEYTLNSLNTSPLIGVDTMTVKAFHRDNSVSSDDYIYNKIHQAVHNKINSDKFQLPDDIMELINKELDNI